MSQNKHRRSFFKYLLGGSVAVTTLSLTSKSPARTEREQQSADNISEERGYRETDHIRQYYEKINF